jgi:hypothetical protein
MPKFLVYATEKVYYTKIVDAPDRDALKQWIEEGDIEFENKDIVDGEDFEIDKEFDDFES